MQSHPMTEGRAAERMLEAIKRLAPAGTSALAKALAMSGEAARQQINRLQELGLVAGEQERPLGAGRPRQVWRLTEAGQRYFPDAHAQLSVQLIQSVRQLFGEGGLEQLIAAREAEARARYRAAGSAACLVDRMRQLAEIRTQEGYMARVVEQDDALLFIEDHCPICAAAKVCQGFCRSEQQLFQEIAGPAVQVLRGEFVPEGGNRCTYRVIPIASVAA